LLRHKQLIGKKKEETKKGSIIEKYEIIDYDDNDNEDEKEKEQKQDENKKCGAFKLGRSNLKINKKGWLYLHEQVLLKIINFVKELFGEPMVSGCDKVIVVGGFANSKYLISRLLKEFPKKKFFTPRQPHLAVVKGALYWICQRRKLKKTRAKYSYGIAIDRKFNNDIDPKSRRKQVPGIGSIVENAFGTLVVRNEEYPDGYKENFPYWIPAGADHLEITLFASEDSFCQYVYKEDGKTLPTEHGKKCVEVKKFNIPIDDIKKERQQFQLKLEYRQNGINLSYIDPNDKTEKRVDVDTTTTTIK